MYIRIHIQTLDWSLHENRARTRKPVKDRVVREDGAPHAYDGFLVVSFGPSEQLIPLTICTIPRSIPVPPPITHWILTSHF